MNPHYRPQIILWLVVFTLLLTTWLGARGLQVDSIWYDEWWSLYTAGADPYPATSFAELINRTIEGRQAWQPPFYAVLLWGWGQLAGWTPFAARALSLLIGVLTVAMTYQVAVISHQSPVASQELPNQSHFAGVGAAVALGASAFFIYYLHEIRVYILHALFGVLVYWSYWRIQSRGLTRWRALVFVITLTGLLYSHYFGLWSIGAIGLYHLLFVRKTRQWWLVYGLMLLAGLLFLPWLWTSLNAPQAPLAVDPVLREASLTTGQLIERLLFMFSNGNIVLLIIAAAYSLRVARVIWFWLICLVGAAAIGNLFIPVISEMRYLISAWPLLAVITGIGLTQLLRQRFVWMLALGLWALVGAWSSLNVSPLMVAFHSPDSDTYNNSYAGAFRQLPWQRLHDTLAPRTAEGDALALHRSDAVWAIEGVFDYYLHDLPLRPVIMETLPGSDQGDEYLNSARQFIADAPRVWLVVDKTLPSNFRLKVFRQALNESYTACGTLFDVPNMSLDLYTRLPDAPFDIQFGEGIGLKLIATPLVINNTLEINTVWSVSEAVPPSTYSVAFHMLDSAGELAAQTDGALPGVGFTCQRTIIPLDQLPAGTYNLTVTVYNWSSGERLPAANHSSSETGERLPLATVELSR